MKKYQLFLDESGQFKENNSNGKRKQDPSIVAGYLALGKNCTTNWAKKLLKKVKDSNSAFSNIRIDPFHGKETDDPNLAAFITSLLQELCSDEKMCLVEFKNERGLDIVNSDITYLNVLTEGIIQIIIGLMKETDDNIHLDIIYAKRVNVTQKEASNNTIIQYIPPEEYKERLEERLILQLEALPKHIKDRFTYDINYGNANTDAVLMIADAVCGALRGFTNKFTSAERKTIKSLQTRQYSVLDHKAWQSIEKELMDKHIAQAVFQWYSRFDEDERLKKRKEEFEKTIVNKVTSEAPESIEGQFKILHEIIGALIKGRKYNAANIVMDNLIKDFYPMLEKAGKDVNRQLFDLHFHRLTTCTHQGTVALGNQEMQICDDLFKVVSWRYEDLEYLQNYKLRKVEQQKNAFDFKGALETLIKLEKQIEDSVNVITLVDDLGSFTKDIKSQMLGKVLGSKVAVECFLLDEMPELKKQILLDSEKAMLQFTDLPDIARQYQTRAMAEYKLGNLEKAVQDLKESGKATNEKLFVLIRNFKETKNIFGLMHYANIMALVSENDLTLGKEMYDSLNQEETMMFVNKQEEKYPKYVILWRVATTKANLDVGDRGEEYYKQAKEIALSDINAPTVYAAGLAILAEYNANIKGSGKPMQQLKKNYETFMESDIPETMKACFKGWDELLSNTTNDMERRKNDLIKLAKEIPIL